MDLVGGGLLAIILSCGGVLLLVLLVGYVVFRSVSRKLGHAAHITRQILAESQRLDAAGRPLGPPDPAIEARRQAMLDDIRAVNQIVCPYCQSKYDRKASACPSCGAAAG